MSEGEEWAPQRFSQLAEFLNETFLVGHLPGLKLGKRQGRVRKSFCPEEKWNHRIVWGWEGS